MSGDKSGTFYSLQTLIQEIEKTPGHSDKTTVIKNFLDDFEGDTAILFRLLLCRQDKRAYHIREKGFVNALSQIFNCSDEAMITDLEQGDIGETMRKFFIKSGMAKKKSVLTLKQVDDWLEKLCTQTKEEQQVAHFENLIDRATANDLYYLTKIIDHDLKVFIGPAYALAALHPDAYKQWKVTNDLPSVIEKAKMLNSKPGLTRRMSLSADLMTPVKPMLARASKSLEDTWKRCPNGMLAEIKYDGERVQIHKNGDDFKTFSRSLKPVTPHKVAGVKDYIPKAFKDADTIILDAEILLQDSNTKKPLPFGTLGIHKKKQFADATLCLYIFDILHLNGENLMNTPCIKRRQLLEKHIKEVPGHVLLTETYKPQTIDDLQKLFNKTMVENLEGLVVKDFNGIYAPNMRHWIKIKKEHFAGMGDSADLIVLGAYFGTGSKGGKMATFLMGVYDPDIKKFKSVVKAGSGFTEKEITNMQKQFNDLGVVKIAKDPNRCPDWLLCKNGHVPDFVMKDPKKGPVWEIGGAEFVPSTSFAAGISIRFPRVTKVRDDKDWKTATSLKELEELFSLGGINRVGKGGGPAVKPAKFDANAADDSEEDMEEDEAPKAKKTVTKKANKKQESEDDDEDIIPQLAMKQTKPQLALSTPTTQYKIEYMNGSVTQLLSADPVRVLLQCSTPGGKWPQKGVFGEISKKWQSPENVFKRKGTTANMGDVISVPVGDGNTYVFILIAQQPAKGVPLCLKSFQDALEKAQQKCEKVGATSIHIAKLHKSIPNVNWGAIQGQLEDIFGTRGVQPYVYAGGQRADEGIVETKKRPLPADLDATEEIIPIQPPLKKQKVHDTSKPLFHDEDLEDEEDEMMIEIPAPEPVKVKAAPAKPAVAPQKAKGTLFQGCVILKYGDIDSTLEQEFLSNGAKVYSEDDDVPLEELTYIVTNKAWEHKLFGAVLAENPNCKIIRPRWISESVKKGRMEWPKHYFVPRK